MRGEREMNDLLIWFRGQSDGIGTYTTLRALCIEGRQAPGMEAATRQLLVAALDGFIERLQGEPFPADLARAARNNTIALLEEALAVERANDSGKVEILNQLAFREIIAFDHAAA
jgi:hypothetical protein